MRSAKENIKVRVLLGFVSVGYYALYRNDVLSEEPNLGV